MPICHYCERKGHIRPHCNDYLKDMKRMKRRPIPRRESWVPRNNYTSMVAHTALSVNFEKKWYFDSACSRHMTGNPRFLTNLKEGGNEIVTFGDGGHGNVIGKGTLKVPGMPSLTDVMLVEGLKANLITISQLCDGGMEVKFNKDECCVYNKTDGQTMKGKRSNDNCYLLCNDEVCLKVTTEETEAWHQRLGHMSHRSLQKLLSMETIRGIPKLKFDENKVCEACQLGKQTKTSHPKVSS